MSLPASAKPIWETYSTLICKYDKVQHCEADMSSCKPSQGSAVITFDFRKMEIHSFVSTESLPLVGKFYFHSPGNFGDTNAVMAENTLYSFGASSSPAFPGAQPTIEGFAQSGTAGTIMSAFNAHMTCHPA
jgi:hypothetical protein